MSFLRNRTVIGVFCILLSVLICFGLTPLFNRAVSQKVEIVRVTQPIRAGEQITDDMVQLVQVGGYNLPDNVLHEKANAVGKYATADLAVGDYIINTKLSDVPAADNAYLYDLDGSQQAISVTIRSFANGLSGKLQSGDIVSVVAPDYKQQGQTVIPPELQYVEVISVTASTGYDANTGEAQTDDEDGKELPSTVTLLVTPEQSKVLAELEEEGTIHLTLVYRGSKENAEKFLTAQDDVLLELYDIENLVFTQGTAAYTGAVTTDCYGRKIPKHAVGTENFSYTSSANDLLEAVTTLYDRIVDRTLLIRRLSISANRLLREDEAPKQDETEQLDLFTDYVAREEQQAEYEAEHARERKIQKTMLRIKKKFGKNAILKGMNLEDGATARERNQTIGGHQA